MAIPTQIEDVKETLRVFLTAYFDGYNHTISGSVVEMPDCHIRMFYDALPEASKVLDKPLITVLLAPGAVEKGRWVTDSGSGNSQIMIIWDKHPTAVGYYVYRSLTEVGGYAKVSSILTGLAYLDTPAAGTYWYQVKWVDDSDVETDHGVPVSHTSSAIVYPLLTHHGEVMFHIMVSATVALGGQRIVDEVCSLLATLFYSSQSAYLKNNGLKFPMVTPPASLHPERGIWTNSMFLRVTTLLEYS